MPQTNVLQTAITASSIANCFRHSEQKRTSEQSHVTNDVIIRVISIRDSTPAGYKLTKLFGINDVSVAKDSGKVIILYSFYNYYYLSTCLFTISFRVSTELIFLLKFVI